MKFKVYDYSNKATVVEIPDKPIYYIEITILSGDETGIVYFKDGTAQSFDASDCRNTDHFDGGYIVDAMLFERWNSINLKGGDTKSYSRKKKFSKIVYESNYGRG